jgi:hypothetical protein
MGMLGSSPNLTVSAQNGHLSDFAKPMADGVVPSRGSSNYINEDLSSIFNFNSAKSNDRFWGFLKDKSDVNLSDLFENKE